MGNSKNWILGVTYQIWGWRSFLAENWQKFSKCVKNGVIRSKICVKNGSIDRQMIWEYGSVPGGLNHFQLLQVHGDSLTGHGLWFPVIFSARVPPGGGTQL